MTQSSLQPSKLITFDSISMNKKIFLALFLGAAWSITIGQQKTKWDNTDSKNWPSPFSRILVPSSVDGSQQPAFIYSSTQAEPQPLIVSLHTWSGDFQQEDPLAAEARLRNWNYIHPDFRGTNNKPEACGSDLVINDLEDAIRYMVQHFAIDSQQIHIIGVSGGGHAALMAYMKLNYPVNSIQAWVPISDLREWYWETRGRKLKYADDLEMILGKKAGLNLADLEIRSPLKLSIRHSTKKRPVLHIYAGIHDGYSGSVPITHSIRFFNKIAAGLFPNKKGLLVSDSLTQLLLTRRNAGPVSNPAYIGGRKVHLHRQADGLALTIFEGGHEMLSPIALALTGADSLVTFKPFHILTIGDSNAAAVDGWPAQLGRLMPMARIKNIAVAGNTIGFNNNGESRLNTLRQIDRYLDSAFQNLEDGASFDHILIGLGTNDTKSIFASWQGEVPGKLDSLLKRIKTKTRVLQPQASIPVHIIFPFPTEEKKLDQLKYGGATQRLAKLLLPIQKVVANNKAHLIDISQLFQGDTGLTRDGIHLLEAAQFSVGRHIISHLKAQNFIADKNLILPPAWAFGILYGGYTNQAQTIERIKEIMAHGYPIDAFWIDSWFWSHADKGRGPKKYIDFAGDSLGFPDRKAMWDFLQRNGIRGGFWVWDCIQQKGNEEAYEDFNQKGFFSSIYYNTNPWHNASTTTAMHQEGKENHGTWNGNIDFNNPKAVAYFKQRMKHFFEEGADFIKLDRTSAIPVCKTMFEMSQEFGKETRGRGFLLSHTGGMESEAYKRYPTKWTDDTRSDWNMTNPLVKFPSWVPPVALRENIAMFTNPAAETSRIPFLTNDLGGFDKGDASAPEEELYIRWMQFAMFNPITEVFSQPENPTSNMAWNYSSRADSLFRFYARWRMQLFPYIYSYAHKTRLQGRNMIQPIPQQLYDYLFGDEILVAPVYEKGAGSRKITLPEGQWIDYWNGDRYEGGKEIVLPAPIEQIPLLIRAGAIIPQRPYASSIEKGSNDTLFLQIYPGTGRFELIEDDGISNGYLEGEFSTTVITQKMGENGITLTLFPAKGSYDQMPKTRVWVLQVHLGSEIRSIRMKSRRDRVLEVRVPFEMVNDK